MTLNSSTETNGNGQLCLPLDSPVRTPASRKPERSDPAWTANARGYGVSWLALLAKLDPSSRSWKTSQTCLSETGEIGSAEYSETWPRSGRMRNGIAYQRPTLALHTSGTESGSWPTPTARDWKDTGAMTNVPVNGLLGRVFRKKFGTNLIPKFCEWLMGFPSDWTNASSDSGR